MCLLLYQSPRHYFLTMLFVLGLEMSVMAIAPWFCWLADLPFKAGVTAISEYSLVICIRYAFIFIFQYPLLQFILHWFISFGWRIMDSFRPVSYDNESETGVRTIDEAKRSVGRPRKT